ncbi:hypothetical protein CH296_26610 [Rhodococcus sp. 14-2496-1d]|uniref:acetyl-CoA hydrolase/transferase family protein n=1 Tax=Rhodococcus sp. 14-2496-1d TaxID=2023146 RepID=UPI000B9B4137|nr:acetyl-CoA hydrolase/transferase C-terminal domain-containing protein [Rhodococcus sp. 14-2496-1d]OZF25690.1 hypothetical protein CH296_26610 [Rhodococcus sp. 14-2496-1d]
MLMIENIDDLVDAFTERLCDGGSILLPQAVSEPTALVEVLARVSGLKKKVTVYVSHGLGDVVEKLPEDSFRIVALAGVGTSQRLVRSGRAEVLPMQWSQLVADIRSGNLKLDIALLQVSPAVDSVHSFGAGADLGALTSMNAGVVFAEINERMPHTFGHDGIESDRIDYAISTDRALPELAAAVPGETEKRIGQYIAEIVPDRAVLQIGIGAVPEAALAALHGHRGLGVHTGVLGDGLMALIERGVVTNEHKEIDNGLSVTGGILGTAALYEWADRNPALSTRGLDYTHSDAQLSRLTTFTAINSAIEVDLSGQINAEVAGSRYIGAVGGQVDFLRAGARAAGGLSVVALGSRTNRGAGKVVAALKGSVVTTLRTDVDMVVTEFGIADLRRASLTERRRRLIEVAHPDDREMLDSTPTE